MIRVMIVDDQAIIRQGIEKILSFDDEIEVVCSGSNGKEALELSRKYSIDVILMDIQMPIVNGIEATKRIKAEFPNIKVIILTTFDEKEYLIEGLKYGVSGYILKDSDIDYIIKAIKEALNGNMIIDPSIMPRIMGDMLDYSKKSVVDEDFGLTDREVEIAHLVIEGLSNKEIGERLFLSEGTVKNYVSKILRKLDLKRRTQLINFKGVV